MSVPTSLVTQSLDSPIPVDHLLEVFADFLDLDVGAGDAATDTLITYKRQLIQFLDWCDQRQLHPAEINKNDIKKYRRWMIDKKGFKPATIALKLSVVRRFYQAAMEKGLLTVNPATGVKAPKEKHDPAEKITYLEASEVEQLFATIPDDGSLKSARDKALLAILTLEGPRTVELHRANICDIVRQGKNWGIRVEGKRNIRIVPLTPEIAQLLRVYLERREAAEGQLKPSSPLFVAVGNRAGGKRISRRGIRLIVDGYLKEAQLKQTPGRTLSTHSLRHTAGTLALRSGAELRQVQDLLGHADPRTTCIYAHVGDRWENNPALKLGIKFENDNRQEITENNKSSEI
ncbi:tyrosine-type recombinase/integrase [Lyngbya sp. PCC 8106]|uniref:tyrosine-type recombinase/integrase n=1 Tax=Lyngbya sp. (strain PCC 8106) TaxID=313612 RepID=UPI0000EAC879|nr:tyrosine-type recombinase/integrase [Lyngbya sp. PCC 8106]EAW34693.1 recombinase [Lyngbya sp. PCC 8106]